MKEIKMEIRTTQLTVLPENEPIFSEYATTVTICNDAAGDYLKIRQIFDQSEEGTIHIDPKEWPSLRDAINEMIEECRKD